MGIDMYRVVSIRGVIEDRANAKRDNRLRVVILFDVKPKRGKQIDFL